MALIENAAHTIDLQYYVWFGDISGQLLLSRVIAAADRGVKAVSYTHLASMAS